MAHNSLIGEERLFNLAELARMSKIAEGDMAELGVYQGGSARIIAEQRPDTWLHLFDTFTGIPCDDMCGDHKKGEFAANLDDVKKYLHGYKVMFHVGTFPGTIDWAIQKLFSFVHVDADTYQSTRAAIQFFWPRMSAGGVIVFDDYCWYKCPGVTLAVHDSFDNKQINKIDNQCWIING